MIDDFADWVEAARDLLVERDDEGVLERVVYALEALAAERAAERDDPRRRAAMETASFWTDIVMEPAPRSYSHWGMW